MTDFSRRHAITATAAGALAACLPAAAVAKTLKLGPNDRRLLELEAEFTSAYEKWRSLWAQHCTLREAVEAMPDYPSIEHSQIMDRLRQRGIAPTLEAINAQREEAMAFLEDRGVFRLHTEFEVHADRCGTAANAIFSTPADTAAGLRVKLRILHMAYGDYPGAGDHDLECYQTPDGSWFASVLADVDR